MSSNLNYTLITLFLFYILHKFTNIVDKNKKWCYSAYVKEVVIMTGEVKKKVIESLYFAIKRSVRIKNVINAELVERGFNSDRIELIEDKVAYQQFSDDELILLSYLTDKHKITNNLFKLCSGFDTSWKDIDYRILETNIETSSKYCLCNCCKVNSYYIGYISIGLLEEAIQKQIVKLPMPPEKVLPVYYFKTINPRNAQVIKIYTLSDVVVKDNKIDLSQATSIIEFDSIFNYVVIKNNINRNELIPILFAQHVDNNSDNSFYRCSATLKKIIVQDVINLCTQEVVDKYNIANSIKLSNIISKIIKSVNDYSYEEKIQAIANVLNRKEVVVEDSSLLKLITEELNV